MRLINADEIDVREVIGGASDFAQDIRDAVQRMIDRQPTIEAAPVVHGSWVEFDSEHSVWACSQCQEPYILMYGTPEDNKYNFCPNCGARMDGKAV